MNKQIGSKLFHFLLFSFLCISSCTGQEKTTEQESGPWTLQFSSLTGRWERSNNEKNESGTLEIFEDGLFRRKEGSQTETGKWNSTDAQHLSLGDTRYRFFFKGRNLVLIDQQGETFEYRNPDTPPSPTGESLSTFIRRIFQDSQGNLWFGTNGDGVIRYDSKALEYFSQNQGFGGVAVRGIVEDQDGHVWFGTEGGLTRYDGASFVNYTEDDGLVNNDIWSLCIDSKGLMWIGTLQGISCFNGEVFTPFVLPESAPDPTRGVTSTRIVHSIMEDSKGKMWFGTNGGAYIYDGKTLSNISEQDGLCNNVVNCILEDNQGKIWFATHHLGVCYWDGKTFTPVNEADGVYGTEVWDLYKDRSGNIWFPSEGFGVYRYDGQSFTNVHKKEGMISDAIQNCFEDREGRLWLGGYLGLFRFDGKAAFPVGRNGPWE